MLMCVRSPAEKKLSKTNHEGSFLTMRTVLITLMFLSSFHTLEVYAREGGGKVNFDRKPSSASKSKGKPRNSFLSVWYGMESGSYGYATAPTKEEADALAKKRCDHRDCASLVYVRDACAAAAVGRGRGYGVGYAATKKAARSIASQSCEKNDYDCEVFYSGCAPDNK